MKAFIVLIVTVFIVGAYLAGYWPEHRRLTESESQLRAAKTQLAEAQAHLRICDIQSRLLHLIEKVGEKNYGDALKLSSEFFDEVRDEITRTEDAMLKQVLESILQTRDSVTAGLAKGDPATLGMLQQAKIRLRNAVERLPAPSASPASVPPPPGPTS